MNTKTSSLLEKILALPLSDRAELIQTVLDSFGPAEEEMSDKDMAEELARRAAEIRADPSGGLPWSEVKKLG